MNIKLLLNSLAFILTLTLLSHCTYTKEFPDDTDTTLLNSALDTIGFHYYQGDSTIRHSSPQSGHKKYFRLRYNIIAYAALTDSGHLPPGGSFPTGSLIVKELFDTLNEPVQAYAIIKKESGQTLSADGWLWGEYYSSGVATNSINKKGAACITCHSINSRDYNRVFDIFP